MRVNPYLVTDRSPDEEHEDFMAAGIKSCFILTERQKQQHAIASELLHVRKQAYHLAQHLLLGNPDRENEFFNDLLWLCYSTCKM